MSTTPVAPSATHHAPSEYTSQSECKLAQDCGLSWFAQWFLGFKAPESDNPAMRVGTLGHACLAEYVLGVHQRREWSMSKAMVDKARDNGYVPASPNPCEPYHRHVGYAGAGGSRGSTQAGRAAHGPAVPG